METKAEIIRITSPSDFEEKIGNLKELYEDTQESFIPDFILFGDMTDGTLLSYIDDVLNLDIIDTLINPEDVDYQSKVDNIKYLVATNSKKIPMFYVEDLSTQEKIIGKVMDDMFDDEKIDNIHRNLDGEFTGATFIVSRKLGKDINLHLEILNPFDSRIVTQVIVNE